MVPFLFYKRLSHVRETDRMFQKRGKLDAKNESSSIVKKKKKEKSEIVLDSFLDCDGFIFHSFSFLAPTFFFPKFEQLPRNFFHRPRSY